MAVFTNTTKNPLSWLGVSQDTADNTYYLLIGTGNYLLIGDTYRLIINSGARTEINWTPVTKSR